MSESADKGYRVTLSTFFAVLGLAASIGAQWYNLRSEIQAVSSKIDVMDVGGTAAHQLSEARTVQTLREVQDQQRADATKLQASITDTQRRLQILEACAKRPNRCPL